MIDFFKLKNPKCMMLSFLNLINNLKEGQVRKIVTKSDFICYYILRTVMNFYYIYE